MKFCLRIRKEHCYFHLGVSTDLLRIIQKPEILKSLHTNYRKFGREAASCPLPGIIQLFTLAQTGLISHEHAAGHQL